MYYYYYVRSTLKGMALALSISAHGLLIRWLGGVARFEELCTLPLVAASRVAASVRPCM